jgi:hypothetical protein
MIIKTILAVTAAIHFWRTRAETEAEYFEFKRVANRRREIERHPELLTGGRSEWERRH